MPALPLWQLRAARLAEKLPRSRLHPAVLAWADRAPRRVPWAVAFSGGADSLALLLLLWAHWPERRAGLVVAHFDHRLRGAASAGDAAFCRRVCRSLGLTCRTGAWRGAPAGASAGAARAARLEFLHGTVPAGGPRALWLAHQRDDVAETLLMRLAQGSGAGGLAAPRPVQRHAAGWTHVRPLLGLAKAELVAALRAAGAAWREDASNAGGAHFRNRIRHAVLPAWSRAAGRDAGAGAALTRERLEEDDAALEAWLDRLAPVRRRALDRAALAGAPRALWRRALHRWLLAVRPETDLVRQGFEQLLAALIRGRDTRFSLGASAYAVLRGGKLRLVARAGAFR